MQPDETVRKAAPYKMADTSKWVMFPSRGARTTRFKMLCFAHAGGGPSFYHQWDNFHPDVEILRVALPGREARHGEAAFTSMETLLPELFEALDNVMDSTCMLFGHSMGSAIAYEVARHFESRGKPPLHLFVSGRRAPHLPPRRPPFYKLPDGEFMSALSSLNGIPESVMNDASLVEFFLPSLRADFTLIETYKIDMPKPVSCPISAYGGDADPELEDFELAEWNKLTTGTFRSKILAGDHFYLKQSTDTLFEAMRNDLGLNRSGI